MDTLAVSFETNLSSSHCDETVAYGDVTVLPPMLEHCWLCLFATAWCFPHLQETTCYSRAVTYTIFDIIASGPQCHESRRVSRRRRASASRSILLPLSGRAPRSAVCGSVAVAVCARANTATGRTSPAPVSSETTQNPPPIACAPFLRDFSCIFVRFQKLIIKS